jgi:hypothetical protein
MEVVATKTERVGMAVDGDGRLTVGSRTPSTRRMMMRQYLVALLDRERCACKLLDNSEVVDELRGRGRTRRTRRLTAMADLPSPRGVLEEINGGA